MASTSTSADMTGWIKTSDRHLSLMNPSTFAKRSSARLAGPSGGHLVGAKQLTKEELEGKKIRLGNMSLVLNGVQAARCGQGSLSAAAAAAATEDATYRRRSSSSFRRSSKRKAGASTPRKTGKKKVRKSVALPCRYFTKTGTFHPDGRVVTRPVFSHSTLITLSYRSPFRPSVDHPTTLCPVFLITAVSDLPVRFLLLGRCNKALSCPYVHDPSKLSICQSFLRGSCANSASACPLSHEPSAHNTPSCSHFASSGVCRAGDACLYPHVRTAEDAPLCADFGRYGWCDKGAACEERHAWECKEFAERGTCRMDGKCGLRHVLKSQAGRTMSPPADGPAFFIDSTGDRPVDEDGGLDRPPRRHGPKVDSSALIANQDDFIQLDFDTDSDEDMEDDDDNSGSEDDEEDGESNEEGNEDIDDEAEVADAVALLVDGDDENPASDADDDDPRPRR